MGVSEQTEQQGLNPGVGVVAAPNEAIQRGEKLMGERMANGAAVLRAAEVAGNASTEDRMEHENAQGLGAFAIYSTPEGGRMVQRELKTQVEQAMEAPHVTTEQLETEVAIENGYTQTGENPVGGESRLNIGDREQEDLEDLEAEVGEKLGDDGGGTSIEEIVAMKKQRDALNTEIVRKLKREVEKNADQPAKLASIWYGKMTGYLRQVYNRIIGARN